MTSFVPEDNFVGSGTYGKVLAVTLPGKKGLRCAKKEMNYDYDLSGFGNIREIEILFKISKSCKFIPNILTLVEDKYKYQGKIKEDETRLEYMSFVCQLAECDGEKFFPNDEKFSARIALKLSAELLLAISHIHSKGIYHRDIKPGNVLIYRENNGEYTLKLIDYGFAMFFSQYAKRPESINTAVYRAPEIAFGVKNYCKNSDIWCAGMTIYKMFTGVRLMGRNIQINDKGETNQAFYFEQCLRLIPREWTIEAQTYYRANCRDPLIRINNTTAIKRIPRNIENFISKFKSLERFKKNDLQYWTHANNLLCDCFEFDYRIRKSADQILKSEYFNDLSEYIGKELTSQQSEENNHENIYIDIPSNINKMKYAYFKAAYKKLKDKIPIRTFYHAVDLVNAFYTKYHHSKFLPYNVFAASLYYFEKFFSDVSIPESPDGLFFKSFSSEMLECEDTFKFIDRFIFDFEKIIFGRDKVTKEKYLFGYSTYRDVPYEIQDYFNSLTNNETEKMFFAFCKMKTWKNKRSYRYMYRVLYNKVVRQFFDDVDEEDYQYLNTDDNMSDFVDYKIGSIPLEVMIKDHIFN